MGKKEIHWKFCKDAFGCNQGEQAIKALKLKDKGGIKVVSTSRVRDTKGNDIELLEGWNQIWVGLAKTLTQ